MHKLSNPDESPAGLFGPLDQLFIHPEAEVEPLVAFDTTKGPIVIEKGAKIQAFTRLEGPCFIGKDTQILGRKFALVHRLVQIAGLVAKLKILLFLAIPTNIMMGF